MKDEFELIIFYDGDCGLCNSSVQFVLNHEKSNRIYFSAIQSEFTNAFFETKGLTQPDFSTFYFYKEGEMFDKSTAALKLAKFLRFPYSFLQLFLIIPSFIRNGVYTYISKRRLAFQKGFCVIPTLENQKRFLK